MRLTIGCNTLLTHGATSLSLKIESLLIAIVHKNKWYLLIPNFKSFKKYIYNIMFTQKLNKLSY